MKEDFMDTDIDFIAEAREYLAEVSRLFEVRLKEQGLSLDGLDPKIVLQRVSGLNAYAIVSDAECLQVPDKVPTVRARDLYVFCPHCGDVEMARLKGSDRSKREIRQAECDSRKRYLVVDGTTETDRSEVRSDDYMFHLASFDSESRFLDVVLDSGWETVVNRIVGAS